MKAEIWKDIPGYEGLYMVSNLGNIRSTDKKITQCNGKHKTYKAKILKLRKQNSGYLIIQLYNNKTKKACTVHRLVAHAFVENPDSKPCVNHIDGNKENNAASNLGWVSYKENTAHAFSTGLMENTKNKARERMKEIGLKYAKENGKRLVNFNRIKSSKIL